MDRVPAHGISVAPGGAARLAELIARLSAGWGGCYAGGKRAHLRPQQTLGWTPANELRWVAVEGVTQESYRYDPDGERMLRSIAGGPVEYTYFPGYEVSVQGGVTTVTKSYFFGGARIAQKVGAGPITYLHGDHLGSTVLTTGVAGSKKYYAYGATRGTDTLPSEWQYTGQEADGTGLVYLHARYYDPASGQFLSPDTLVPDPADVLSYNRFLYARANPLKYTDPTGHEPHDDQLAPCDWQPCVKINGQWVRIATWTPELHAQYYPDVPAGELPFDPEMVQMVLDRATNFEMHYDDNGEVDWRKTFVTEFGDVLSLCAIDAGGVCGISAGASGAVVGVGGRISLDFYVDDNGQMAGYISGGGGLYATFTGLDFKASGISVIWVPSDHADALDMAGWSVQLGGSAKAVAGLAAEWIVGKDTESTMPWHGYVVGQAGGAGVELHASATYSHQPELVRRFLAR